MATLHLLGTGAAFSGPDRTTTMLAFQTEGSVLVVDCGADAVQRLLAADIDLDAIDALIVTHEHADHVAGFPLFMERLWLAGRRRPVDVYGIRPAIDQARRCWEAFDTSSWKDVPEIRYREVLHEEGARVLETEHWRVTASPGEHGVPVVGVRVEDVRGGGVVAYSADTARSDSIARLAEAADVLVHEAMREEAKGHTTYEDAAHVARQAGVGQLILVHLPPDTREAHLADARQSFPETRFGSDGESIAF